MSQDRLYAASKTLELAKTYYGWLGLHPSASPIEIRRAYREKSKRYHPDTTELPTEIATAKFQQLNEAYATLSNPERRLLYDTRIGYSRFNVIQAPPDLDRPQNSPATPNAAYLDPTDRPLSSGELFALFILGLTFIGCVLLAIGLSLVRGDAAWELPQVSQIQAGSIWIASIYHGIAHFQIY
ncbi:MAG: J domain-containing protein [Spirulinaceae cyanobacterium]